MKAEQVFEKVTNQIVAAIESGDTGEWRAPWHSDGTAALFVPTNASTGKSYKGGNVIVLWATALQREYPTGVWATFKQWQALGARVRKGERGTHCVKWTVADKKVNGEVVVDENGKPRRTIFPTAFVVFNAAQVDGWEPPAVELPGSSPIEHAETFFESVGADVRYGGNQAFYARVGDYIQTPRVEQFDDSQAFYATLGHEHVHWTGAESRLNRTKGQRFGDNAYAYEELIAELGSAFVAAHLQLANEPRPDHASYLKSWLSVLRSDPKALYSAASEAQKAVDHLLELAGEIEHESGAVIAA
jgi:antirestriction protein ArdC